MRFRYDSDGQILSLTMRRHSNFHAHLRDGVLMEAVAPAIMRHPRYVLAMPNTGPITTIEEALAYRERLLRIASNLDRQPDLIMTLYLNAKVTSAVIEEIAKSEIPFGVKYYPPEQGATTGSGFGVPLDQCDDVLRAMEETGVRLLGHFETVTDRNGNEIPPEEREGYMVDNVLWKFRDTYPKLRHCFEHASTRKAVEYVAADTSGYTVMTVTPQHSLLTSDHFEEFGNGLKCMPIVKTVDDREAIARFITSGDARAIAGDDTAPHPQQKKSGTFKEAANGCWLPHAAELYAMLFGSHGALDGRFERFMSLNGPRWWGLPEPGEDDTVTFERRRSPIPEPVSIPGEDDVVVPLGYGVECAHLDFEIA